ncbi:MAG: hypothetical protein ABJA57_00280 [Ginsengibacter sp.]
MKQLPILHYLVAIAVVTIVILLVYATVQQSYRTNANDPQIQIAEDLGAYLQAGKQLETICHADTIDIGQSLSPVVTFYDGHGNPVKSTGFMDGKMCRLPAGLFDQARREGIHSVTWQPRPGVRMALVLLHVKSSNVEFVAAARSLREVEVREYSLRKMIILAWILCIAFILVLAGIQFSKYTTQATV